MVQHHKKKKFVGSQPSLVVRQHFRASLEDAQWVLTQDCSVLRLWVECQVAEHFGGNDWRPIDTTLKDSTLRKAKAILQDQGLFDFKAPTQNLSKFVKPSN